jgi:hypothetical protein
MHSTFDHLSIWEIAHRWHDIDPNLTEQNAIPLQVQDTVRMICKALVHCEISVCNDKGIERKNPNDCPDFDDYQPSVNQDGEEIEDDDELWEQYEKFSDGWNAQHLRLVDGLEKTYEKRTYEKSQLEQAHINQHSLVKLCREWEIDLPEFWFTKMEISLFCKASDWVPQSGNEVDESPYSKGSITRDEADKLWATLQHKQKARLLAREIAKILWKDEFSRTIVDISKNKDFLKYGQCEMYAGKNTLRDWIKDLNPNSNSGGRPRAKI